MASTSLSGSPLSLLIFSFFLRSHGFSQFPDLTSAAKAKVDLVQQLPAPQREAARDLGAEGTLRRPRDYASAKVTPESHLRPYYHW